MWLVGGLFKQLRWGVPIGLLVSGLFAILPFWPFLVGELCTELLPVYSPVFPEMEILRSKVDLHNTIMVTSSTDNCPWKSFASATCKWLSMVLWNIPLHCMKMCHCDWFNKELNDH